MARLKSPLIITALAVLLAFAALGMVVAGVASIYGPRAVADATATVRACCQGRRLGNQRFTASGSDRWSGAQAQAQLPVRPTADHDRVEIHL